MAEGRLHPRPHRRRSSTRSRTPPRSTRSTSMTSRWWSTASSSARASRPASPTASRPRSSWPRAWPISIPADVAPPRRQRAHRRRRRARGRGRARRCLPAHAPRRPHRLLREIRLPGLRLHHRRDRAAPVLASTRRRAPARPATASARSCCSTRTSSSPTTRSVDQEGRGRALGQVQPALALITCRCSAASPATIDFDLDTPWSELPEEAQRRHPPRHRRPPVTLRFVDGRKSYEVQEAVRGRDRQPQPPHAPDRKRVDARGAQQIPGRRTRARPATAPASGPSRWRSRSPARTSRMSTAPLGRRRARLVLDARRTSSPRQQNEIARAILKEINERLGFLHNVGLDYLNLDRTSGTLSGGESQRIRLASQIGSRPLGRALRPRRAVDRPPPEDNDRLLETLKRLRDLGNTVLVVEHDEDAIRTADHVIDMGPGAGVHGGEVVAPGTLDELLACENSLTADYLTGRRADPDARRSAARATARSSPSTAPAPTTSRTSPPRSRSAPSPASPASRARASRASPSTRSTPPPRARSTARASSPAAHDKHHRPRISRQGDRHRPVADRPHPALQPGDLHRRLHPDPRLVRRPARKPGARLQARPLQLQRQGRPLRGVHRATACSRSRCTSCPTSTSPATSATASATTARRWR